MARMQQPQRGHAMASMSHTCFRMIAHMRLLRPEQVVCFSSGTTVGSRSVGKIPCLRSLPSHAWLYGSLTGQLHAYMKDSGAVTGMDHMMFIQSHRIQVDNQPRQLMVAFPEPSPFLLAIRMPLTLSRISHSAKVFQFRSRSPASLSSIRVEPFPEYLVPVFHAFTDGPGLDFFEVHFVPGGHEKSLLESLRIISLVVCRKPIHDTLGRSKKVEHRIPDLHRTCGHHR